MKLNCSATIKSRAAVAGLILSLGALLAARLSGAAEAPVGLGTAGSFAVLAGAGVTNTGPTVISGDLGTCPTLAITGFPPGIVNNGTVHAGDAVCLQAQSDLTTAYNDAAGRAPTVTYPGVKDLGGETLTAGVYKADSFALTGTLTLDAQGDPNAVFIFQAGSTLITAPNSQIVLINGAQPCNVFWQVGSSATIGVGSTFIGSILALTSITANTNATVQGRLLARNGAVTLDSNTVTIPACAPITTTTSPVTTTTLLPTTTTTLLPTTTTLLPTTTTLLPTTTTLLPTTTTLLPTTTTLLPPITVPPITLPPVTVPPTTLPPITLPPVTVPPVTVVPTTTTLLPTTTTSSTTTTAPATTTTTSTSTTVPATTTTLMDDQSGGQPGGPTEGADTTTTSTSTTIDTSSGTTSTTTTVAATDTTSGGGGVVVSGTSGTGALARTGTSPRWGQFWGGLALALGAALVLLARDRTPKRRACGPKR